MRVLIADDEKTLVKMMCALLRQNKIDCDAVYTGLDAFEYAKFNEYDLIILDIMMPELNGYEVVKKLREDKNNTPVLMLSAKGETEDKVTGLNLGADDYLTKPFAANELLARVAAVTRRRGEYIGRQIKLGNITLDKDTFMLASDTDEIKLSNTEFKIMEILMSHPQKIINKDKLIEKVWGLANDSCYNNIEVYISFLRKKLLLLKSKVIIKAVRGAGYILGVGDD
ncbi:MAG: response regulator transcription factor [Christensenellaceae bacterium]|jgi:DNA-binding response OmpR family regulator|nr:response regulator transcription factor [Christensenellaceae bacterium]